MKKYIQALAILLLPLATWAQAGTTAGVTYTIWGKSSCPTILGTQQLYKGRAGGTHLAHRGGGANYLCMPETPEYTLSFKGLLQGFSYVYGAEYQYPVVGSHDHNVPCAVCYASTRQAVLMIPAMTNCPPSWTREYYGYLMSDHIGHFRTTFECVDKDQESIPGSQLNTDGAAFYHVEANCNGQPCPPYDNKRELTCVVCTR